MKIKAVCDQTGLTDRAVRFYISECLISPDFEENYLGRRSFRFSDKDVRALQEIVVLRKFDFSVAEIRQMQGDPEQIQPLVAALKERKQAAVAEQQAMLSALSHITPDMLPSVSALADALSAPAREAPVPKEPPLRVSRLHLTLGWLLFDLPRIVLFVLPLVLPVLLILRGLYRMLFTPLRLSVGVLLAYLLIPALFLFLLIRLLRKDRSACSKVLRALGLSALMLFSVFLVLAASGLQFHSVIRQEAAARFAGDHAWVPAFQELNCGDPVQSEYHRCEDRDGIGSSEAEILLCRYAPDDYVQEKEALELRFAFIDEPLEGDYFYWARHGAPAPVSFEPTVRIGDDVFRFAKTGFDSWEPFYMRCCLVITNNSTSEIGYLYYQNMDVDAVTDIQAFLLENCCWRFVR